MPKVVAVVVESGVHPHPLHPRPHRVRGEAGERGELVGEGGAQQVGPDLHPRVRHLQDGFNTNPGGLSRAGLPLENLILPHF